MVSEEKSIKSIYKCNFHLILGKYKKKVTYKPLHDKHKRKYPGDQRKIRTPNTVY